MKHKLLLFILFLCSAAFAQEPVYQVFDVDSAAQPRGGMVYLNTFLQANLRKPTPVEAKGLGGRVIVSGIVEADGRITDAKVAAGKVPELDREAVRVFSLFNAWQPALKGGKAVRQQVSIPITFKPNPPFAYAEGARIDYFDADHKPVEEGSEQARYKQVSPMDTNGLPTGDIVIYKGKDTKWKEDFRLRIVRNKSTQSNGRARQVYTVGYVNEYERWQGRVFNVDAAGALISQEYYENGQSMGSRTNIQYHANGSVAQLAQAVDDRRSLTSWYSNGQIKQIWTVDEKPLTANSPEQVAAHWDSTGRQLVNNGTGHAYYSEIVQSLADTTQQTRYDEEGSYKDGLWQGIWTGRYADGSYFYEEHYDKGVCQGGKAVTADHDTIHYTVRDQQPEFVGGLPGLGQFLMQNLRYPIDAQRARAQGKVLVSFVVCTDGTLCDYEVVKRVNPSLDQEAVRVVKAMSGQWKPGVQRGRKVRVKYSLPVNFTLE